MTLQSTHFIESSTATHLIASAPGGPGVGKSRRNAFTATLRDGTSVELAPLGADDRDGILRLLEGLSERSRTLRFATPTPRLTERQKTFLTTFDGHDHVVWGAFLDGELAGLARFVRFQHDRSAADVAVSVADAHHGRGLGSLLLEALAVVAPSHGIERFGFSVVGSNRKAIRLLSRFGARFEYSSGMGDGELPVTAFARGRLAISHWRRSAKQSPDQVSSMAQILKSTSPASSPALRTSA